MTREELLEEQYKKLHRIHEVYHLEKFNYQNMTYYSTIFLGLVIFGIHNLDLDPSISSPHHV